MRQSLFAVTALVSLLAGCVSVAPTASTLPTGLPSLGITTPEPATGTPSVTATPAATSSPTPTAPPPTQTPTATPVVPPSPAGSPSTIEGFGADILIFADDFSDISSGFGVGANTGGTVAYVDDALQFDTAALGSWMWSRRENPSSYNVMHVEADMTPSALGYQGLLCANSDDDLWGAVANAAGLYAFIHVNNDGASILGSNQESGFEITPGETTRVAVDCAGTATGNFRLQLSLPDTGLAASYTGGSDGGLNFDRAGAYAESAAQPYTLRVDNLFAYGGSGETGMSAAATALLQHVPADWRAGCFETQPNPFETGAEAALSCVLSGARSDVADYVQFDTKTNMDEIYQARVDTWAVTPTASCQSGPNEVSYTIAGAPAGRILCAPQAVGIRVDWTHDALTILSTLTDFDGSYGDTYEDWLIAGPEEPV